MWIKSTFTFHSTIFWSPYLSSPAGNPLKDYFSNVFIADLEALITQFAILVVDLVSCNILC